MRYSDVKKIAKRMNLAANGMHKTELIRAIQRAERNLECYGTERVSVCGEEKCLWRPDCLDLNHAVAK